MTENTYHDTGSDGDEFGIRPEPNRKFGIVDVTVEAGGDVERSRSRSFDVDEDTRVLVHLAVRWNEIDDEQRENPQAWNYDLERRKRLVESM